MPGPWVADDILTQDVAAAMQMDDPSQMGSRWTVIISAANVAAAQDLTKFVCGLGYTISQVDEWDDRFDANRRLGLLYALQRGNPLGKIDAEMIKSLDPRQAIRDQGSINISGTPTAPTASSSTVGGIASGTLTAYACATRPRRRGWLPWNW